MVTATVLERGGLVMPPIPHWNPSMRAANEIGAMVSLETVGPIVHAIDRTGRLVLQEIRYPWPV
jgi:hypothetical protein